MVKVRRARRDDLPALLPLVAAFCAVDHHPYNEERVRIALGPLLHDDAHGVVWLVVDDADVPVGYAVVTWGYSLESGGREALVDEIYVERRGAGTGGILFDAVLDDIRERGITRAFLETEVHNVAVRRFYARHGFEQEPSIWMSRTL